jgi:hypothetical protein
VHFKGSAEWQTQVQPVLLNQTCDILNPWQIIFQIPSINSYNNGNGIETLTLIMPSEVLIPSVSSNNSVQVSQPSPNGATNRRASGKLSGSSIAIALLVPIMWWL